MRYSLHFGLLAVVSFITAAYAFSKKRKIDKKRCVQIVTVILTLFSGLRSWQIGDVFHYCAAYLDCNLDSWKLDFTSHDSVGTQLLYRAFGQLHLGFEVCLFCIAAFSAITLGVLIFKYSTSPYLSYLIYIAFGNYIFTFSVLKQTIAMGFITLAMIAIIEAKPIRFYVFVGIAALFHAPACVFLIAYIIAHKRIDFVYFLVLAITAIVIRIFRNEIVAVAANLYYTEEVQYSASEQFGGKFLIMLVILLGAAFLHPIKKTDITYRCFFNIIVVAAIIQSFSIYDNVFTRLADYYFQFFVIFVPLVFDSRTRRISHSCEEEYSGYRIPQDIYVVGILAVTVFCILFYKQTLKGSTELLSQFNFCWEVNTPRSLDLLKEWK